VKRTLSFWAFHTSSNIGCYRRFSALMAGGFRYSVDEQPLNGLGHVFQPYHACAAGVCDLLIVLND
jgi:hypothetical protein